VTNKWVRQVKIESLEDDLDSYNNAIQDFLKYVGSDDFVNPWKYNTETHEITPPSDGYNSKEYQTKLDEVNKWKQRFSDDIKGLDPANYQKYGNQYTSLSKIYDNIASIFESSSGKLGSDIFPTMMKVRNMDFSQMPIKEGVDTEGNPIYKIGQGNNVYRDPIVGLLQPIAYKLGSTTSEGTILGDQANLLDYAKSIEGTSLFKDATKNKQTDFNDALKALDDQLKGVDKLSTMKNYYDLLTSANRLKEAIYHLKPSPAESESISQSISRSGSESVSISRSGSESVSKSQSVSMSTSFSESLSTSSSMSESLSTSSSFSESLSTSSSLSESLSTSSSLSESLSTSSSLSESLSTSSSLSESLSTSSSLSESLSTSSSLSESLSTSSSLSESLSTSSSLSESLSTSSSLSESLSTSSSLSESLSTSSSLSESLSTSSSLSESLSTSSSLSESLSTSSSLSGSLSTSSSLSESLSTSSSLSESLSTSSSLS